ncbi:hypothetical protein ACQ4LE_000852 [Meloidogyne hapla]
MIIKISIIIFIFFVFAEENNACAVLGATCNGVFGPKGLPNCCKKSSFNSNLQCCSVFLNSCTAFTCCISNGQKARRDEQCCVNHRNRNGYCGW